MTFINYLLAPFAFIYGIITLFRNKLYDSGFLKTYEIPMKSICVGNLSVGGTGKSPMVAFLLEKYSQNLQIHVLSRGYGRKTKGYILLDASSDHLSVGDEPLMYYKRSFPGVKVSVCEARKQGVERIISDGSPDLLILDDAFQHRKVKAGFSIVLTDYSKPFYKDYLLPAGRLRENRTGIKRADLLIFSKCPEKLSETDKQKAIAKSNLPSDKVFFSTIKYGGLKAFSGADSSKIEHVLLVSGIANPNPLINYLKQKYEVESILFPDHHNFTREDLLKIYKKFDTFASDNKAIITTEKDYVRLLMPEFADLLAQKPWFYQQMTVEIDRSNEFLEIIESYVRKI